MEGQSLPQLEESTAHTIPSAVTFAEIAGVAPGECHRKGDEGTSN